MHHESTVAVVGRPVGGDLVLEGRAAALDLHRAIAEPGGSFGVGCVSLLDLHLDVSAGCATIAPLDGGRVRFVRSDASGWVCTSGPLYALIEHRHGWSLSTWRHVVVEFARDGMLRRWRTDAGQVEVVRDSLGQVVVVEERSCGHRLHVDWSGGVVAQLTTDDGQAATFTYRNGVLIRVAHRRAW